MAKKDKEFTGKQKVAALMVALGSDIAAQVFKFLKDEEVEEITLEISRLGKLDSEVKQHILEEFNQLIVGHKALIEGGLDFAKEILEKSVGPKKAMNIINKLTSSLQVRPFEFVRKTDPEHLYNFIQNEHPQTIALILAYLPTDRTAEVIQNFPPETQAEIARRIATMDRTSPEVLHEVENVLERKLASLATEEFTAAGGIDQIVEVLNAVDRTTEKNIIDTLEENEPELAEEIKRRLFVFEDIVLLGDREIQLVLKEVDMSELGLALKAVGEDVKDKIFKNMSKRAVQILKEDMEYMGPVRMRDVEEAQQKIVNIIRRLEENGEIIIARGGGSEEVVV